MVTRSQLSTTPKASLGSIVGACLHRPDGELLVDGLATEIITLAGSFLPGANGSVQARARRRSWWTGTTRSTPAR